MKTATVRQLRTEFPKVLAWVHAGDEVAITRRRKVVAKLSPAGEQPKKRIVHPDYAARLKRVYGDKVISAETMVEVLDYNKGRY